MKPELSLAAFSDAAASKVLTVLGSDKGNRLHIGRKRSVVKSLIEQFDRVYHDLITEGRA